MKLEADVVIFGGGCAGLWLLDALARRGARVVLLEAGALGGGQTSAAQGILHGGLKYSLGGILSPSSQAVRDMPAVWNASLTGRAQPDLSAVRVRRRWCYLWRGQSLGSWAGMLGAVATLAVRPVALAEEQRPSPLRGCPGQVYRLDEPVIDPISFVRVLAERHRRLIWKIGAAADLDFEQETPGGKVIAVQLAHPGGRERLQLRTRCVVLSAGEGNARLRDRLGLPADVMQRRPLRVALVRGALPPLDGHCIDGAKTRVTVTSDTDHAGREVWQLGGQLSEDGAAMEPQAFLAHARNELAAVLPCWRRESCQWATFVVQRAERATSAGARPGDAQVVRDGNVVTVWPTKLVLAPRAAACAADLLDFTPRKQSPEWLNEVAEHRWPAPGLAAPLWEREQEWIQDP